MIPVTEKEYNVQEEQTNTAVEKTKSNNKIITYINLQDTDHH